MLRTKVPQSIWHNPARFFRFCICVCVGGGFLPKMPMETEYMKDSCASYISK